jgi:phosphoenolpyruvate-protein phosphotransferase (PTS system enzyme I)
MSLHIKGIAASSGIAIAKAFRLENPELTIVKKQISDIDAEITRLDSAIQVSNTELEKIRDHANAELGEDKAAIFSAHILVLNDPELVNPVKDKIKSENVNAEFAMNEVASMFVQMF